MISHARRVELFGEIAFVHSPLPGNPEHVTIDRSWRLANLTDIEWLGRKLTVHRKAKDKFLRLFAAWENEGLIERYGARIKPMTFASRFKRQNGSEAVRREKCAKLGAASLSNHAFASALDVFAQELPLGRPCPPAHPMQLYFVPIARGLGFEWGGDYINRKDPMHLEITRL